MLEAEQFTDNTFVTLTYDDDHLPSDLSLIPSDLQLFLKRLRKEVAPNRIRYFGVGEYGDVSARPHYHLALFNYPNCFYGTSRYGRLYSRCCAFCDTILDTWGKGMVMLGELNTASASYVAQYVTKKMTGKDDFRLQGRYPEFARMSLKPGIGAHMMHDYASTLLEFNLMENRVDVPSTISIGGRQRPLGRYLTRNLRKLVGRDEKAPQEVLDRARAELLPLREAAFEGSRPFKKEVSDAGAQARLNMENRSRIFKQRKDKL